MNNLIMNLHAKAAVNIPVKNAKSLYVKAAEKLAAKKRNPNLPLNRVFVNLAKRKKNNATAKKIASVLL